MIVTLIGTGPDSFDRLVQPLDELAHKNHLDVFIQLGHTRYVPSYCKYERFLDRAVLLRMIEGAELVITQGGYGGIRDALLFNKPIVAVPRDPALSESPDYQDEIVRAMEEKGYLIGLYDMNQLESAVERASSFSPAARAASAIPSMLADYVTKRFISY